MKNSIITVCNLEESTKVQEILFQAGFVWHGFGDCKIVQYCNTNILIASENGEITWASCDWELNEEDEIETIFRGNRFTLEKARIIKGAKIPSETREMSVKELSKYISSKEGKKIEIKIKKD